MIDVRGDEKVVRQRAQDHVWLMPVTLDELLVVIRETPYDRITVKPIVGAFVDCFANWESNDLGPQNSLVLRVEITPTPLQSLLLTRSHIKNHYVITAIRGYYASDVVGRALTSSGQICA